VVHDLVSGAVRPLEPGPGEISDQVWAPDGSAICYTMFDGDKVQIRRLSVDETAAPEVLVESVAGEADIFPTDWAPDGSMMVFARYSADQTDLWMLPGEGGEPRPLLETEASEDLARFSPDGKWLAYEANHEGRQEVYVRAWIAETGQLGAEWKISDGGGRDPIWNKDGGELYYEDLDDRLVAVKLGNAPADPRALIIGGREVLFDLGAAGYAARGDESYDTAPGGRFVFGKMTVGPREARVVLGWAEEMKRRMAAQ
jgi:Tol biopolymer transport system component